MITKPPTSKCPLCDNILADNNDSVVCENCGYVAQESNLKEEDFTLTQNHFSSQGKISWLTRRYSTVISREYNIHKMIDNMSKKMDIPEILKNQIEGLSLRIINSEKNMAKKLKSIVYSAIYYILKRENPNLSVKKFAEECGMKPMKLVTNMKLIERFIIIPGFRNTMKDGTEINNHVKILNNILNLFERYGYLQNGMIKCANQEEVFDRQNSLDNIYLPSPVIEISPKSSGTIIVLTKKALSLKPPSQYHEENLTTTARLSANLMNNCISREAIIQKLRNKIEKYSESLLKCNELYAIKVGKLPKIYVVSIICVICKAFDIAVTFQDLVMISEVKYESVLRNIKIIEKALLDLTMTTQQKDYQKEEKIDDHHVKDHHVNDYDDDHLDSSFISNDCKIKKKLKIDNDVDRDSVIKSQDYSTNLSGYEPSVSNFSAFKLNKRTKILKKIIEKICKTKISHQL